MDGILGLDVSRWQGKTDWGQVAEAGYRFVFVRATIGDYYTDPQFVLNWDGARGAGLLVSAYHVIAPKVSAEAQVSHFLQVLDGRLPDLPLALDVERSDGVSRETIAACALTSLRQVESATGRRPIIYTAGWFWSRWVPDLPEWTGYDLWIASYTEEPVIPDPWSGWLFWQYSEAGKVLGIGSRAVDLNRFQGDYDALLAYAGQRQDHVPDGEEPQPAVRPRARVIDPKLNLRSGPGTSFEDLGDLHEGDVIEIRDLAGNDVWVEVEPGKWAAFAYKGERYMTLEPCDDSGAAAPPQDEGPPKEEE